MAVEPYLPIYNDYCIFYSWFVFFFLILGLSLKYCVKPNHLKLLTTPSTKLLKKESMKKTYKIFIFLIILIVTIFSVAIVNLNHLVETYIKEVMDDVVKDSEQGIYQFEYKEVYFHAWNGDFEISGVKIEPKDGITDSVKNGVIRSAITGKFNTFTVSGLSFWKFYKTKNIVIDEITVNKPIVELMFNPDVEKPKREFDLSKIFSKKLKSIAIKTFRLQSVKLNINNILRKNHIISVDSMNFTLNDIRLDSMTISNKVPLSFSGLDLFINKSATNISPFYMLETGKFHYKSANKTIEIDSINIIPKYTELQFNNIIPYEKAYLKIKASKLLLSGFDLDSFLATKKIYLDKILLENPYIDVYKNKKLKDPPYSYKKILTQSIREIPIKIKIDTIKAENGFIKVRTIGNKVPQTAAAVLNFNSVHASITGLTNDSVFLDKKPVMNIYFYSKFMGAANLNAQISMPIFNAQNYFKATGSLDKMDASVLNNLLYRLLLIKIESGYLTNVNFDFVADKDSASGYIDISYKNLKIDIKNTEKPNKSVFFVNALVNTITKTNNIKGTASFTRGFISYKHDYNDKFIKYLWKIINNGITNTLLPAKEVKGKSKKYRKDKKQETKDNKKTFKLFKKN